MVEPPGIEVLYQMLRNANAFFLDQEIAFVRLNSLAAGLEGAVLTGGLPIVTMVGVYVALGAGYFQAREAAREENNAMGFAEGFVCALLGWKWHHVANILGRWGVLRIFQADEAINVIRVKSYDVGLKAGFLYGKSMIPGVQKVYLDRIRQLARIPAPKRWASDADVARNQQISYVIALATTGLKSGVINYE